MGRVGLKKPGNGRKEEGERRKDSPTGSSMEVQAKRDA